MLDCRRLNKVIVNLIHEIKHFVTDYFIALNQKDNRRLVEHNFPIRNIQASRKQCVALHETIIIMKRFSVMMHTTRSFRLFGTLENERRNIELSEIASLSRNNEIDGLSLWNFHSISNSFVVQIAVCTAFELVHPIFCWSVVVWRRIAFVMNSKKCQCMLVNVQRKQLKWLRCRTI